MTIVLRRTKTPTADLIAIESKVGPSQAADFNLHLLNFLGEVERRSQQR